MYKASVPKKKKKVLVKINSQSNVFLVLLVVNLIKTVISIYNNFTC